MIVAMKSVLAEGGQICIMEILKNENRPDGCALRITDKELIDHFTAQEMVLVERKEIRSITFMKFEVKA